MASWRDADAPDLSMMGSGLFGGSPHVASTPAERQQLITGIQLRAKVGPTPAQRGVCSRLTLA